MCADLTLQIASLSAEPRKGASFVAAAFDVDMSDQQREAFIAREPEYDFEEVPFFSMDESLPGGRGVICVRSSDDMLRPGAVADGVMPGKVSSVWNWQPDSGLLPASVYLRHCLLAVEKAGPAAYSSFLKDTYLVDRRTTLEEYLHRHPEVWKARPPTDLESRFNG